MQDSKQKYLIKIVKDLTEFQKLEAAWNDLLEHSRRHVPFLCFDWFRIWFKHFLGGNKLFIILLYKDGRLVAIAPLMIKREKFRGMITTKKIELIGNFHSHVRNVISNNGNKDAMRIHLETILDFLDRDYTDWDLIELDSMPEEDEALNIWREILDQRGLKKREYFCFGDWYLDGIDYSGDEYIKKRSKNTRSGVGKKARRMEKLGHLEFRVGTDREKLDEFLALYQEVRGKSWKYPEKDTAFLNEARRMAAEKQCLKFGFLFLNGLPIATLFAIISKGIAYLMEVVYDSEFERFSPGEIIHGEFIKYLIDVDKVTEVDALRGDEPYKKSWTPQRRERKGVLIFNRSLRGQILSVVMNKLLPIIEKHEYASSLKNKFCGYLKKKQGKGMLG